MGKGLSFESSKVGIRPGNTDQADSGFLALWLSSLLLILVALLFVWGSTDPAPRPDPESPTAPTPFSTLLHTIPILFPLLLVSLAFPLAFLFLLKHTVRPVLTATAALVPTGLFICAWWAFIGSFGTIGDGADDGRVEGTWWGTTGLRLFSLVLLAVATLFARMMWLRRKRLERTVAVVEVSFHSWTELTRSAIYDSSTYTPSNAAPHANSSRRFRPHQSPISDTRHASAADWLLSAPVSRLLRLMLTRRRENTWIWHVRPYAGWLVFFVTLIWLWTWGVVRGVGRVAVAAIVGEWYFHR